MTRVSLRKAGKRDSMCESKNMHQWHTTPDLNSTLCYILVVPVLEWHPASLSIHLPIKSCAERPPNDHWDHHPPPIEQRGPKLRASILQPCRDNQDRPASCQQWLKISWLFRFFCQWNRLRCSVTLRMLKLFCLLLRLVSRIHY